MREYIAKAMIFDNKKIYGRFIGQPLFASELFGNLPKDIAEKLKSIQIQKKTCKGEILTQIGEFPKTINVLLEGEAQIELKKNDLRTKHNIRRVEKGEILGLTQFVSSTDSEIEVRVLSDCLWNVFKVEDFLKLLKEEPQICYRLANQLSMDIQDGYRFFSSMSF